MKEKAKTLTFVAVAAAVWVLVLVTWPSLRVSGPEDVTNQPLYRDFNDPLSVASMEIVEFDEQRGEVHPLQVAQVDVKGKTRWSIPSHDDYPADAKDQVASAAAGLMGLKILEVVSDNQGDQPEYGVVDPNPKALKIGAMGVGERVVMKDKSGKELLALVIGKEVPGRPGLRYVRKVGQAPIYIVQAKTDKLSTKFEDFIERNLLGISSLDIKRLWIRDYSVDQFRKALVQRGETVIEYNDTGDPKWKLVEERKFKFNKEKPNDGQWAAVKLPADEELNTAKLDELKTALDDLKIVDVSRKPAGLSADLKKAADFTGKDEAFMSLMEKGFFLAPVGENGPVELFSNEGEIRVTMKDGVEYVLRFGEIAGASKKNKKKEKTAEAEKDKKGSGVNRYLFVMAEFNPNLIAKPQLEPLPSPKKDAEKEKKPDDKKPGDKKADEKKADDKKPGDKKADDKKAQDAERQRVEKENKRKQEEYDQKIADGKKRVGELNARFADWYYIISDEVFRKIHLGHDEIFKKKEKAKEQGKDKKDEHAGHNHGPVQKDATPAEKLEKMQKEGPAGK
jgi:hypothetical protein